MLILGKPKYNVILRTALNLLNRNEKLYKDIPISNTFDGEVLKTLLISVEKNGYKFVVNFLNYMQACHYINLMMSNKKNEQFIGWFRRVDIIKL